MWDIPPIEIEKVPWLLPRRRCGCCGKTTTAGPPFGQPGQVCYGPNLNAAAVLLSSQVNVAGRAQRGMIRFIGSRPRNASLLPGRTRRVCASSERGQVPGRMGSVGKEEPASAQIGQKATEMATQIELTARDLARVGKEATALAGALAGKVATVAGSRPEDADGPEISQQAYEVAGAIQKTTGDALRIAQKAVEMASKIAKAPSGGSGTPPGEDLPK